MASSLANAGRRLMLKMILIAGLAALFFVLFALSKEIYKKRQIQSEIEKLQQEAERIGHENAQIEEKIAYLQSRDFQEREAKNKLGLTKPDENLVIIKPGISRENQPETAAEPPAKAETSGPANPIKWWNYFFKY